MTDRIAPDVDDLAQFIRSIDGDNRMGAGVLAEKIVTYLAALPAPTKTATYRLPVFDMVKRSEHVPAMLEVVGEDTVELEVSADTSLFGEPISLTGDAKDADTYAPRAQPEPPSELIEQAREFWKEHPSDDEGIVIAAFAEKHAANELKANYENMIEDAILDRDKAEEALTVERERCVKALEKRAAKYALRIRRHPPHSKRRKDLEILRMGLLQAASDIRARGIVK